MWQTGILTYLVSIIFGTVVVGVFIERFALSARREPSLLEIGGWFAAFFISGGFSETWVVIQITALGLGLLLFLLKKDQRRPDIIKILLSCLLASSFSLYVIARAPGNLARNPVTARLSIDLIQTAIIKGFINSFQFLSEWVSANTIMAVMIPLAGLAVGLLAVTYSQKESKNVTGVIFLCLGAYSTMWASFALYYAVMGVSPVERVIFMPMYLVLWVYLLVGLVAGVELRKRLSPGNIRLSQAVILPLWAILLVLVPVRSSYSLFTLVPSLRLYTQHWEARDARLRQAGKSGQKDVVVESLRRNVVLLDLQKTFWIEGDLQESPENWVNRAAASYYGVNSIALSWER